MNAIINISLFINEMTLSLYTKYAGQYIVAFPRHFAKTSKNFYLYHKILISPSLLNVLIMRYI